MIKNIKLFLFILLSVTVVFAACRNTNNKLKKDEVTLVETTDISIRLPIPVVDAAFGPLYIGQDKDFFEKAGFDVKLEPGSSELNPVKMVSQGTNPFGILGGPELAMSGKAKGGDFIAVALLHKNSNFSCIITKKDSGLNTLKDLEGKDVGFFYGHISTDILRSLFTKENTNVKEVDVGFNYSKFIAGDLPAQWAFITTAGINLPAKGIDINIISPSDYGIETHGYTIIVNREFAAKNPEKVVAFLRALVKATQYSIDNEQETIESVIKRKSDFNVEVAKKQLEVYNKAISNNPKIGLFTTNDFEATKHRMVEQELLPSSFDINSVFDPSYIQKVYGTEN